jgi:hypothetical protein
VLPITGEVSHHTSGGAIGSDFEYRRTRVALSGAFGLGRIATAVPQLLYGRLTGTPLPQASFFLGGSHSLRSVPTSSRAGTGLALARVDVIGATDILRWARIPHPDAFPLQAGIFGGIGAVWGPDPTGGPAVPGVDWPDDRHAWLSEAGVSILYQPGIPDPTWLLRLSRSWALGPARELDRWSISYTRALDLVKPFGP